MVEQPGIQLDIGRYVEDKAAGITKIVKLNGQPFYSVKEYTRTGAINVVNIPIALESVKDLIRNIEAKIANDQQALASAKQVLADIATAPEVLI